MGEGACFVLSFTLVVVFLCLFFWHFDNIPISIETLQEEHKELYILYPDSVIHFYFCPHFL